MKNYTQRFKDFSLNESQLEWDEQQQAYTFEGEPVAEDEFDSCYGIFNADDLVFFTFNDRDAIAEFNNIMGALDGTPEMRYISMRPLPLTELIGIVGPEKFKNFIKRMS